MCEITNGKIYIADRDLVCYKVMVEKGEELESIYQGYEYEIGREYCVKDFEYWCLNNDAIYEVWYKTFTPFAEWRKIYSRYPTRYSKNIKTDLCKTHCGFYSYTYYGNGSMDSMEYEIKVDRPIYESKRIKCVRCRIPEGSKYMVSDNGEVFISERIVIDDAWLLDV